MSTSKDSTAKDSKQTLLIVAAAAIVILLGISIFFIVNNARKSKQLTSQEMELNEQKQLNEDLELQYEEAVAQLNELKGENEELNNLIEQQIAELAESKERINQLIANGQNLKEARRQIARLKDQQEQYLAEINELKAKNEELAQENVQLSSKNKDLIDNLSLKEEENMELQTTKAALVSEKEVLAKKVDIASVIKVRNIEATGLKVKNSGKLKEKNRAKAIDRLRICFDATSNQVADPGLEEFYIRILNPRGETMVVESLGSGIMTNASTKEQLRYTQSKEVDYNNDETKVCAIWKPDSNFEEGNYEVEIYNKGYLAGAGTFQLK